MIVAADTACAALPDATRHPGRELIAGLVRS